MVDRNLYILRITEKSKEIIDTFFSINTIVIIQFILLSFFLELYYAFDCDSALFPVVLNSKLENAFIWLVRFSTWTFLKFQVWTGLYKQICFLHLLQHPKLQPVNKAARSVRAAGESCAATLAGIRLPLLLNPLWCIADSTPLLRLLGWIDIIIWRRQNN